MRPDPDTTSKTCTAFAGHSRLASGGLGEVARRVKAAFDQGEQRTILIFDDTTAGQIELDLRGSMEDVLARVVQQDDHAKIERKVGRPKAPVC